MSLILLFSFTAVQGKSQHNNFDRSVFYKVMKTGTAEEIDAQLIIVRESLIPEKEAYEGTLLMKRSALLAKAMDRLKMFKSGRSKLEFSISKDSANTEYRLLRLMIQEHAPRIVNYRGGLEEDSGLIKTNFNNLSPFLQKVIIDYSKNSKVLKIP